MAPAKIGLNNGFLFTDVEIHTVLQSSLQIGKTHGNKHQERLVVHSGDLGCLGSMNGIQSPPCNSRSTTS